MTKAYRKGSKITAWGLTDKPLSKSGTSGPDIIVSPCIPLFVSNAKIEVIVFFNAKTRTNNPLVLRAMSFSPDAPHPSKKDATLMLQGLLRDKKDVETPENVMLTTKDTASEICAVVPALLDGLRAGLAADAWVAHVVQGIVRDFVDGDIRPHVALRPVRQSEKDSSVIFTGIKVPY